MLYFLHLCGHISTRKKRSVLIWSTEIIILYNWILTLILACHPHFIETLPSLVTELMQVEVHFAGIRFWSRHIKQPYVSFKVLLSVGWRSDSLPTNRILKGKNSSFTAEEPSSNTFTNYSRLTSPMAILINNNIIINNNNNSWPYMPSDIIQWEGRFISMLFVSKIHTPDQSWWSIRQTQIEGHSTKYLTKYFSKVSLSWKTREAVTDWRRLRGCDE